ncbi:TIGR01244 family sulfur transferase [Gluconobacter wancherniae]|uniref:TIGR01244 family sulfur transferase n=1 Tax=Gluconobacter wancherniae TaxID=1307955 RepID=UPI0030ABD0BA
MAHRSLTDSYAVSSQISVEDVPVFKVAGYSGIICLRPDGEEPGQPLAQEIANAAQAEGIDFAYIPVRSGTLPDDAQVREMRLALDRMHGSVLGYCRSGTRAAQIWALAKAGVRPAEELLEIGHQAGVDLTVLGERLTVQPSTRHDDSTGSRFFQVVIVGGGAGGLSVASSLLKRDPSLSIAVVEPSGEHFYQPGWTLVGAGIFKPEQTLRAEANLMPKDVTWLRNHVTSFAPDAHEVSLDDGAVLSYGALVVATGIVLDWSAISGLEETLGQNGVTSNYRYDLAPYTWKLVNEMKSGTAIFTQPPMPIKCAGAPQKAMYLSCDKWRKRGALDRISVEFNTATPSLFGVKEFVPALMEYVRKYGAELKLGSKLVAVDGPNRIASFDYQDGDRTIRVERKFDMLHVVPPQKAPKVVRESALAGPDGFVAVNSETLQHVQYPEVFAVGDVAGTSNAKTAAAARVQAPVVAVNVLAALRHEPPVAGYDGYGACPLTVENGRIVLAEFSYGGKLAPTMPLWLMRGTRPTRLAWWLKKYIMPVLYWHGMLKGRELFVRPRPLSSSRKDS